MTIYFGGGESSALTPTANCIESTAGGRFDSARARLSLGFTGSATIADYWSAQLTDPTTGAAVNPTTVYLHAEFYPANFSVGGPHNAIEGVNASGVVVWQFARLVGTQNFQPQYWDGAAFVSTGITVALAFNTLYALDFEIICGASGACRLWVNGNGPPSIGVISDADCNNISSFRFKQGQSTQGNMGWSQIIAADELTVGWKLYTRAPTSNGANTAWTGAFGDVDEAVTNDADFIESTAANDVETFLGPALTLGSEGVKAVIVSARIKTIASGPQNAQAALRRGGTNYFSANLSGLSTGYVGASGIFEVDPSTAVAWTVANAVAAATEFGLKSIT